MLPCLVCLLVSLYNNQNLLIIDYSFWFNDTIIPIFSKIMNLWRRTKMAILSTIIGFAVLGCVAYVVTGVFMDMFTLRLLP